MTDVQTPVKFEDGKLVVQVNAKDKIDSNRDGKAAVEFESQNTIRVDAFEVVKEIVGQDVTWLKDALKSLGVTP